MHKALRYIFLFLALVLVQVFLLDNLQISVYLNPLLYIAFVLLLPIETPPVGVLLCALAMGVTMDWTMGAAGVNTIATLPIALLRLPLLRSIGGKEVAREGGIPSPVRLGRGQFLRYVITLVLVHHLLFFVTESLSLTQFFHTLLRLLVSSAVTVLFTWPVAQLFTTKFTVRS